jgi:hypothetical protein
MGNMLADAIRGWFVAGDESTRRLLILFVIFFVMFWFLLLPAKIKREI